MDPFDRKELVLSKLLIILRDVFPPQAVLEASVTINEKDHGLILTTMEPPNFKSFINNLGAKPKTNDLQVGIRHQSWIESNQEYMFRIRLNHTNRENRERWSQSLGEVYRLFLVEYTICYANMDTLSPW